MTSKVFLAASLICALALPAKGFAQEHPSNCQYAVGNSTQQWLVGSEEPWSGPVRMNIGGIVLDGVFESETSYGYGNYDLNETLGNVQEVGLSEGTFDFGDLGAFHIWGLDMITWPDETSWEWKSLVFTGPARGMEHEWFTPWGSGLFADTDAELRFKGWWLGEHELPDGTVVSVASFFLWGQVCNVDLSGVEGIDLRH